MLRLTSRALGVKTGEGSGAEIDKLGTGVKTGEGIGAEIDKPGTGSGTDSEEPGSGVKRSGDNLVKTSEGTGTRDKENVSTIPKIESKKPCRKRKSEASALLDGLYEPVSECK